MCSGNVPVDLVVRNTLDVLEVGGASHVQLQRYGCSFAGDYGKCCRNSWQKWIGRD
ncbi:MAG: hypothetical protein CM1200mP6_08130 [Anaerolineaceae bacterium]|nr:MAG: hypothetical protein CM1200mP6_08130 [Anaerolineaceae bacterium]